jgi:hypothetical protein
VLPCYPTPDPKAAATAPVPPAADDGQAPRPIGPERLRALREAILNGTYPTEAAVASWLTSLFRQPPPPPQGDAPKPPPGAA